MSATAVITDIVTGVIDKLRGKPVDWSAQKIAAVVADKATEALITVIAVELAKFQAALGLQLAAIEVAEATQKVLEAFSTGGGKSIAALVDVEIVDKFDTSDTGEGKP